MNDHIARAVLKHKQGIILVIVATALAVYIIPFDSLFTHEAIAQNRGSGNGPYGHAAQGPPSSTPGGSPGERSQGSGPPEQRGPPAPRGGPPG